MQSPDPGIGGIAGSDTSSGLPGRSGVGVWRKKDLRKFADFWKTRPKLSPPGSKYGINISLALPLDMW
jgi:hypothetical protein